MRLSGQILHGQTFAPLPGVKIFMYCSTGSNTPIGEVDPTGNFSIDVPNNFQPIVFSAPGFMSVLTDPGTIEDSGRITLTPSNDDKQMEVVSSAAAQKKNIPWWVVVGGGLALASAMRKKPRAVGADFSNYVLPVGILIGGYFLISKLGNLFTGDNNSNNDQITTANEQATQSSINQATSQGIPQTKSDSQLSGAATAVYSIGSKQNGPGTNSDQQSIVNTVINSVDTLTDYLKLKYFFGTKKVSTGFLSTCYALGFNCNAVDLDAFLRLALDEAHIDGLINYFRSQGINYSF